MASLLCMAHDPGGANMLTPAVEKLRARGMDIRFLAAGPALDLWADLGAEPAADNPSGLREQIDACAPDLLVTGTSDRADLEREAWEIAAHYGVSAVAVIDAWMNFRQRFQRLRDGREIQPGAVCVPDIWCRQRIMSGEWWRGRVHVTGSPHLQALTARLAPQRANHRPNCPPLLAFFSEHIREACTAENHPGYDQFEVAGRLLDSLAGAGPLTLALQPHPLEQVETWERWLRGRELPADIKLELKQRSTERLLLEADGVIGMTTMVLVEAALLGVPTLSLQPDRRLVANPGVDWLAGMHLVTSGREFEQAVRTFLSDLDGTAAEAKVIAEIIDEADARLAAAISNELDLHAPVVGTQ